MKFDFVGALDSKGCGVSAESRVMKVVKEVMVVITGGKVRNLCRLKGSTFASGAVSNLKKPLVKVELGGSKPNGGSKLIEKRKKHQPKCKQMKVTLVLLTEDLMCYKDGAKRNNHRGSLQKRKLQVFKILKENPKLQWGFASSS